MCVNIAAERSLSGTPMHLLLVDAPNRAVPMNGIFHARLGPFRALVCSYAMDGICRLPNSAVALWTGYWVTQRELSRINLDCATGSTAAYNTTCGFEQSSVFNPAFAVRDAIPNLPTAPPSPLLPTTSATTYFLREFDPFPSCSILTFWRPSFANHPRAFFSSGDYCTALFGRLQHGLTSGRLLSQTSHFLWRFFCVSSLLYSPDLACGLLWERIIFCFRIVSSFKLCVLVWPLNGP